MVLNVKLFLGAFDFADFIGRYSIPVKINPFMKIPLASSPLVSNRHCVRCEGISP